MPSRRTLLAAALATPLALRAHEDEGDPVLDRTSLIHGGTGPFAVAGYRIGEAALRKLKLTRASFNLEVIHHAPREVQWSCIVDGLQASTGASLGKLNLSLVTTKPGEVYSVIRNRKTGQELRFELKKSFIDAHLNLPPDKLSAAGVKMALLSDEKIFQLRA